MKTILTVMGLALVFSWGWPLVNMLGWLLVEMEPVLGPWLAVLR